MRYEAGDQIEVTRNQGKREATVLAVIGDDVLIEYTMPKGTTALNFTTHDAVENDQGNYKAVSYRNVPVTWLKAIVEEGLEWVGYDQRNHRTIKTRIGWDVRPCGLPTPTPLQLLEYKLKIGLHDPVYLGVK
jgi:hypothetical protein